MTISYKLQPDDQFGKANAIWKKVNGISSSVPLDPANTDYQEYLEWVAAGNTAEAAD